MKRGNGVADPMSLGRRFLGFQTSSHFAGWMISYADMMTIILTFTVLLLSISEIPQTHFDLLVEALTGRQVGTLREVKKRIDEVIGREALGGEVETRIDAHGLSIEFSNTFLFASGEAVLLPRAERIFQPIGNHLVNDLEPEYGLIIEGYTDDVPIANEKFQSNWELSASRAIHVMERLARAGLDRHRISVQGYADTRAAAEVDLHDQATIAALSEEELRQLRAQNRRVVIRIDRLGREVLSRLRRLGVLPAPAATPSRPPGVGPDSLNSGSVLREGHRERGE